MSDVHSVGGYVTAGSLFALGLASWQVLIALLVGITIVLLPLQPGGQAQPGDRGAVPGASAASSFGVLGANIPAIIRGLIAVAWYGIQTYLASAALDVVLHQAVARARAVRGRRRSTGSPGCRCWAGSAS